MKGCCKPVCVCMSFPKFTPQRYGQRTEKMKDYSVLMDVEKLGHLIQICMFLSIFDYLQIKTKQQINNLYQRNTEMKMNGERE